MASYPKYFLRNPVKSTMYLKIDFNFLYVLINILKVGTILEFIFWMSKKVNQFKDGSGHNGQVFLWNWMTLTWLRFESWVKLIKWSLFCVLLANLSKFTKWQLFLFKTAKSHFVNIVSDPVDHSVLWQTIA